MAASFKTSKSDLVSIYRLEFYKKQKNWKFCNTERKKEEARRKAAKNAKTKLNQTYSIDPAPERDRDTAKTETEEVKPEKEADKEQVETEPQKQDAEPTERAHDLNEAFVDTETEDTSAPLADLPPSGPYSPKWSIKQWAARCRPECISEPTLPHPQFAQSDPGQHPVYSDPLQPFVSNYPTIQPYEEQMFLEQALYDCEADLLYKMKDVPRIDTNLPHGANIDTLVDRDWGRLDNYESCEGWPRQSEVWTNRQEGWFEEIHDIPEEAIEAIEALEVAEAATDAVDGTAEWALLGHAADWLRSSSQDTGALCRSESLPSVSSGSFSRGAALAPHSTQLELGTARGQHQHQHQQPALAAALTAPALAHAVAEHAAALHALLSEARRRDQQASPPLGQQYEHPTRDCGPAHTATHTHTHSPAANDVFVAGSFNNKPALCGYTDGVGRGRGRKVRVIGIQMGRPYRL